MEGCLIEENVMLTRVEADRALRSYRRMNSVLHSSHAYGKRFGDGEIMDEAAIHAQMYSLRVAILSVDDARERMLLYHYYVKGNTLEMCAKLLGISRRSIYRLKNRALDSIILKMNIKDSE